LSHSRFVSEYREIFSGPNELERHVLTKLEARHEGIASETRVTAADRTVIDHFASRVDAADTRARIRAFAVVARAVYRAIGTNGALGTAIWRSSDKRGQARAYRLTVQFAALAVKPARRETARIAFFR